MRYSASGGHLRRREQAHTAGLAGSISPMIVHGPKNRPKWEADFQRKEELD